MEWYQFLRMHSAKSNNDRSTIWWFCFFDIEKEHYPEKADNDNAKWVECIYEEVLASTIVQSNRMDHATKEKMKGTVYIIVNDNGAYNINDKLHVMTLHLFEQKNTENANCTIPNFLDIKKYDKNNNEKKTRR